MSLKQPEEPGERVGVDADGRGELVRAPGVTVEASATPRVGGVRVVIGAP